MLIWSPMGKKKNGRIKRVGYYWGKLKFYDLRAVMTINRQHSIAFAFSNDCSH